MAPKKAKSSAKPNTNKLPGCTSLHKDYNTVIDLITNIYLSTGKCTPTQFQTKYPKVFNKFNPDSVKGLIYRVKKNLQKQTYNADPPPDPSATPASNDKDKKKSHSSDELDPSDEEENDANSFSEEEEVSGSDSDSDGDSDSDSDSDISMGSSPASSAKKERRKKSKPFILFHSI